MAFCTGAAAAQTPSPNQEIEELKFKDIEELNLEKLLDITISLAAGRAQRVEDAPGIASVITDEEIRRLGARTLSDVLQFVPGFEVIKDALGRDKIVVRGTTSGLTNSSSESVLILFNGHRLNQGTDGDAISINLEIPVDNLKRIEIIRGPGSALFGANAFLGVINLVPYTANDIQGIRLSSGGGSFGTQQHNILGGYKRGDFSISGFAQFKDTDGPRLLVPADAQTAFDNLLAPFGFPPISRAPSRTRDNSSAVDANLQLTYKNFTANARFQDTHSGGFIGATEVLGNSRFDTQQILFDAGYRYPLGDKGSLLAKFSFNQNKDRRLQEYFPPGFVVFTPGFGFAVLPAGFGLDWSINTRRYAGETVLEYQLFKNHHFTLGMEYDYESTYDIKTKSTFDSSTVPLTPLLSLQRPPWQILPPTSRKLFSVYGQHIWTPLSQLDLTTGVRYDHYSDFGDTVNPRVGLVWRFAKDFNLKLLYGRAFRAPSFYESRESIPNLLVGGDLKPTTLQTVEAGIGYSSQNKFHVSATYFATFIRDFIVPTDTLLVPKTDRSFANADAYDIQGLEFETKLNLWDHTLFANYTFQHSKDKSTGESLPDVPAHIGSLGLTLALGDYFKLTPAAIFRGSRPRFVTDTRKDAPGYALFNLTLQAKTPIPGLELSGSIYNLFDKNYTNPAPVNGVPGDYPRPGRSFFLKAIYKF